MIIGIDFDNTIIDYDVLFYKVAVEKKLVPESISQTKIAVREYLRNADLEDEWTELQGDIYGARMAESTVYPGFLDFLKLSLKNKTDLFIISHKTKYPFLGPRYDLHSSARKCIEQKGFYKSEVSSLSPEKVFFELTKKDKCERIRQCRCSYFIDDLPEIFHEPIFPLETIKVLFDSSHQHQNEVGVVNISNWFQIIEYFSSLWK